MDTSRLVIGGVSAGGGLAAALVQRILDEPESHSSKPIFQLLVYPMLDDRTVLRIDTERVPKQTYYPLWTPKSNRFGWTAFLGHYPSYDRHSSHVPARKEDLAGLPPAFIGVGTLDLFHEEDVEYASRLRKAGAQVQLEIVEGAFHGFDGLYRKSEVGKAFREAQSRALKEAIQ